MGVLYDGLDLKRGCQKHSFLNNSFLQSRHILLTKKKTISANSLEQQILSLERQRREVILSLPLTFTEIIFKTDITISVICPGQEITEFVITVIYTVYAAVGFTHQSSKAYVFPVGISSCALVRQFLCGGFLLCISSQPEVCRHLKLCLS